MGDTDEVKAAKAEHAAAHAEANARVLGEAVASAYLADLPEVVEAKAAFQAVFDKYAAGEVALPVAPVHEVPAVVAPAAVAPMPMVMLPTPLPMATPMPMVMLDTPMLVIMVDTPMPSPLSLLPLPKPNKSVKSQKYKKSSKKKAYT